MANVQHINPMEQEYLSEVGCALKKARNNAGYSAIFVSSYIDVSLRTYQRYEAGIAIPDTIDLLRLSRLYNLKPYYFLIIL